MLITASGVLILGVTLYSDLSGLGRLSALSIFWGPIGVAALLYGLRYIISPTKPIILFWEPEMPDSQERKPTYFVPSEGVMGMGELHDAASSGDYERVIALIAEGDDVNALDYGGYTPLHWVADMGHAGGGDRIGIILALASAGANLQARDTSGRTPFDTAVKSTSDELAYCLHALSVTPAAVWPANRIDLERLYWQCGVVLETTRIESEADSWELSRAFVRRGDSHLELAAFESALSDYDRSVEADPSLADSRVLSRYGVALRNGEVNLLVECATALLEETQETDEGLLEIRWFRVRADALERLGRHDTAAADRQRADGILQQLVDRGEKIEGGPLCRRCYGDLFYGIDSRCPHCKSTDHMA